MDKFAREKPQGPPNLRSVPRGAQQLGEQIGKGGYGVVYRGMRLDTGEFVAVKQVTLTGVAKEEMTSIEV